MSEAFADPGAQIALPGGAILVPGFFGRRGELFGCYHGTAGAASGAALLCPAFGYEYIRSHRAYRHLADRLARGGRAALRFDLFGNGDSAGGDLEAGLGRWRLDVATAAAALRERSGVARPVLVGRRLGAALAVLHGVEHGGVDDMVLWDPVVSGATHLEEMERAHRDFVSSPRGRYLGALEEPEERREDRGFVERMGQRISDLLLAEIGAMDLRRLEAAPARRVLLVETRDHPEPGALAARLEEVGVEVHRSQVADPQGWTIEDPLQQVVPNPVLAEIEGWITRGEAS